jgi:glycosyltransferase involved in cell wall biosynthesis
VRIKLREKYGIRNEEFLIVSGGKIDSRKNIHLLLEALNEIKHEGVKLVLFGSISSDISLEFTEKLKENKNVLFLDWLDTKSIYDLILASDLGVFPGTHSVLWEQCVGVGLPCIFKKWEGIDHVQMGGNCILLEDVTVESITNSIKTLLQNPSHYNEMREKAKKMGPINFTYSEIAKKAIEWSN